VRPTQRRRQAYTTLIEQAWEWLEHWGHAVSRVDLDDLRPAQLLDLLAAEQLRVRVLASEWRAWW
jgi:hypothetical protein